MNQNILKKVFADEPEMLRAIEDREQMGMMKELYKETIRTQQMNEAKQDAEIVNVKFLKGEKGDTGDQGVQGMQGEPGEKGERGASGKKGSDGIDGKDGKDGVPGKDGKDGADARMSLEDIYDVFIERMIKEKPIDISQIRNAGSFIFQGTKYKTHELMHGGMAAGSAAVLTFEQPAGVIDDSNVTFTVANEPLFIVVNGAQYKVGNGKYASYAGGTITLTAGVGDGGFIESYYNA